MSDRVCRVDGSAVVHVDRGANRSIVGSHPLAVVRYACGHWEYVRHDVMDSPR